MHLSRISTSYLCLFLFPVSRFAHDKVQPLVKEMDENSQMDGAVISGMFEQGVYVVECICMLCSNTCKQTTRISL